MNNFSKKRRAYLLMKENALFTFHLLDNLLRLQLSTLTLDFSFSIDASGEWIITFVLPNWNSFIISPLALYVCNARKKTNYHFHKTSYPYIFITIILDKLVGETNVPSTRTRRLHLFT
jgi:hypothetical protein